MSARLRYIGALTRRQFVSLAAPAAVGLPLLFEACAPSAPASPQPAPATTPAPTSGSRAVLPTYVPFQGPQSEFPGNADGLPPGYTTFPANPVKSVPQPPGNGGTVSAFTTTFQPPPPPLETNAAWQALNKQLNVQLDLPIVNISDYATKLGVTVAGSDLPDLVRVSYLTTTLQNLPAFLQSKCEDLTPYLAGDAVKDYPNLANLPSYVWPNGVFNNRLWAVPSPSGREGVAMMVRGSLLKSIGKEPTFTSLDDFVATAKQLAIPQQRYALGSSTNVPTLTWFLQIFGAPNQWREQGGKLTRDLETPEYRAAVGFMRSLWDQGLIHPDAATWSSNQAASAWYAGQTTFWLNASSIFPITYRRALAAAADFEPRFVPPFSADGRAPAVQFLGGGTGGLLALKKAPADRIKELLGVLNFLAAPFGTEEYLAVKFGVKDVDYTVDAQGNPVLTDQGTADLYAPWFNLIGPPPATFDPIAEVVSLIYHFNETAIQHGINNPVAGLYSPTDSQKAALLNQQVTDGVNAIIYGRADLSSLDQVIQGWRSSGGDQIRAEYEQALQDRTA